MQRSHESPAGERGKQQTVFGLEIVNQTNAHSEISSVRRLIETADVDGRIFGETL
jgi:hypothetical protein